MNVSSSGSFVMRGFPDFQTTFLGFLPLGEFETSGSLDFCVDLDDINNKLHFVASKSPIELFELICLKLIELTVEESIKYSRQKKGRGVLVVKSRLWGRRVPGSRPHSTEDPPCMGSVARQIVRSGQTSSRWCGVEAWRGGCQTRCRPRQLTVVQNYEVRPKIALVLLQSGTLI
ncbi:hypothetical protein AVEN_66526-1 [Araneus ventricosus]|uniref:Uncharacterized protein n=1 Tax=Araneus ventricosus TaxID=182803 RepID=A0A4Y2EE00_ARAVE|nr:hypothetical protein AVEN_66526-1 [Araneus ventricosus]